MVILTSKISRSELNQIAEAVFGNMVKAVVDIEKEILALDAELHADLEAHLLEKGSRQPDLWGINLYPEIQGEDSIEFDSMINLKPKQNNRSRGVENAETRRKITSVVRRWVEL